MVARGDLGVEVGYAELTGLQKHILQLARSLDRVTITATQMMESMIHSPVPTRAEVSDVANAVLDGSDAVMLSGESAVGKYPVRAVEAMAEVIDGAEKYQFARKRGRDRFEGRSTQFAQAIAHAVMYTANHMDVEAIVALTESGSTPLWMSRIRSDIPIFAFTRHERTQRRVALYRGVLSDPVRHHAHRPGRSSTGDLARAARARLREAGRRADPDARRAVGRVGRHQHDEAAEGRGVSPEIRRHRALRRHRGPDDGRQRRRHAGAAAARQGRARHRQDAARGGDRAPRSTSRCTAGTSSRRPRRSTACTSTTRSRACATRSSATRRSTTSATTSSRAGCGRRSRATRQAVLLIDEIDKADIEFPNDLLLELDRMEFYVHETRELIKATQRPIVVITSNNEKELPDAFLRRCFFHFIRFPDAETMTRIVGVHYPGAEARAAVRGAERVLQAARGAGPEEEAVDLGAARLAQAAARRGRAAGGAAHRRPAQEPAAAVRRAAQERAGRAPVRAADLPAAASSRGSEARQRARCPDRCDARDVSGRALPGRAVRGMDVPAGTP